MIDHSDYRCPLHPSAQHGCSCTKTRPVESDLDKKAAIGLWRCANEHTEIAGPVLSVKNRCIRCGRLLVRIAVGIYEPKKVA